MDSEQGVPNSLYLPLRSPNIRLVSFNSAKPGPEINIDLLELPLTEELEYCALSYVWGEKSYDKTIWMNEHPVLVTQHLYNFLELARTSDSQWKTLIIDNAKKSSHDGHLPRPGHIKWWIDALCIDQMNIEERNEQVPRMGKIYSSAEQVMIWMGTGNEVFGSDKTVPELPLALQAAKPVDEDRSKSFFAEFFRLVHHEAGKSQLLSTETEKRSSELEPDLIGASNTRDDNIKALQRLLREMQHVMPNLLHQCHQVVSHLYFTRTWIIQEYVLGRNHPLAFVGSHVLNLVHFFTLRAELWACLNCLDEQLSAQHMTVVLQSASMISLHIEWSSYLQMRMKHEERTAQSHAAQLSRILNVFRQQRYTKVHDMFYGIVGLLVCEDLPNALSPDYRLPFGQVSWDYTRYIIEHTNDLRIIDTFDSDVTGYPTWVPDLRYRLESSGDPQNEITPPARGEVSISTDGRKLRVEGAQLGRVICCTCPGAGAKSLRERALYIRDAILD